MPDTSLSSITVAIEIGGKKAPVRTVLVDEQDAHWLDSMSCCPDRRATTTYVICYTKGEGRRRKAARLHHLIMQAEPGEEVDHINHDGLDNRRENLRMATRQEQAWNRRAHRDGRSGYKGVLYRKDRTRGNPWMAYIRMDGKRQSLGHFSDPATAARAYDVAARKLHGEFACLNFPYENLVTD